MGEMVKMPSAGGQLTEAQQMRNEIQRMADAMQAMASMIRTTAEAMESLRRQVRLLEKVTPGQATAINRAIRERAQELCGVYGAKGGEKKAAAEIRRSVKLQFGAVTARDIPRCDYEVAMEMIKGWDDYKAMMAIRGKVKK